ncbi:MAG TPA: hypothetical protein VFU13_13305 [Steroidobacteraceae bacterium]|nr:hypothetical protein [Steroidobacteraceae bacterium]
MARLDRLEDWKYLTARIGFLIGLVALISAWGLPAALDALGYTLQ